VWDSLGEAFMKSGDTEDAIANYNRSLALNPGNGNAKAYLAKLEAGHE
jgi:cytochrome c-type biogenesis protein CcmH/NrfG